MSTYMYQTYADTYMYASFFTSWERYVDFKDCLAFAHSNFLQV